MLHQRKRRCRKNEKIILKIGNYKWSYKEIDKFDDDKYRIGSSSYPDCKIEIKKGMKSVPHRVTILHEIFHSILESAGYRFETNRECENATDILANGLVQFIDKNPKFFKTKILSR